MKYFKSILSIVLATSLIGCGNNATSNEPQISDPTETPVVETETEDVKDDVGYVEEHVEIECDDHKIPAIITVPTKNVKSALVMMHGTGSNKDEAGDGYKIAAPILATDYGVATIRFDFMGNGESTADYENYNFETAVSDCIAARNYLLDSLEKKVDIGVLGWSQGGTDALLACGLHPDDFGCCITWAGAPDLSDMMSDEQYQEAMTNGYYTMEFEWRDPLHVGKQWCEDVKNTDVLEVFSNFKNPVCAIAGEDDITVDPKWSEEIVNTSTNEASELYLIEGMDHTFNVFSEEDHQSLNKAIKKTGQYCNLTLARS